jgi:hypothetical protein
VTSEHTPDDSADEVVDARDKSSNMRGRRRVLGWLPTSAMVTTNKNYRAPGTQGGRKFLSTEHLATEAVAAYVDGELRMNAYMRASQHLEMCGQCRAEVEAQSAARSALRRSGEIPMPARLLGELNQIPTREIDLRAAGDAGAQGAPVDSPLDAPGFPVHRGQRRRDR